MREETERREEAERRERREEGEERGEEMRMAAGEGGGQRRGCSKREAEMTRKKHEGFLARFEIFKAFFGKEKCLQGLKQTFSPTILC